MLSALLWLTLGVVSALPQQADLGNRPLWRQQRAKRQTYPGLQSGLSTGGISIPVLADAPAGLNGKYYAEVDFGLPSQRIQCLLSSAHVGLVVANNCTTSNCGPLPEYSSFETETLLFANQTGNVSYRGGTYSGPVVYDFVALGPFNVGNATFLAADTVPVVQDAQGYRTTVACLFGIGAGANTPASSTYGYNASDNFMSSLVTNNSASLPPYQLAPSVGLYLGGAPPSSNTTAPANISNYLSTLWTGGEMVLGGINETKVGGPFDIVTQSSMTDGRWIAPFKGVSINNSTMSGSGGTALWATGSPWISGPSSWAESIAKAFGNYTTQASGNNIVYVMPCSPSNGSWPTVGIAVNQSTFTIPPSDLVQPMLNSQSCRLAFEGSNLTNGSQPQYTIGNTFFRNVYSQFNYSSNGNGSIGFALLAPNANDTVYRIERPLNATNQ